MTPSSGKTAMVLSGGGANGAYEVGVLKALCTGKSKVTQFQPLNPDIFSGTSIGSFNAAVLVSRAAEQDHCAAEYLEKLWLDVIPNN
jgi:NTE family protein